MAQNQLPVKQVRYGKTQVSLVREDAQVYSHDGFKYLFNHTFPSVALAKEFFGSTVEIHCPDSLRRQQQESFTLSGNFSHA